MRSVLGYVLIVFTIIFLDLRRTDAFSIDLDRTIPALLPDVMTSDNWITPNPDLLPSLLLWVTPPAALSYLTEPVPLIAPVACHDTPLACITVGLTPVLTGLCLGCHR